MAVFAMLLVDKIEGFDMARLGADFNKVLFMDVSVTHREDASDHQ